MSEWWKHFLSLINLNPIMKKTTTSSEKPVTTEVAKTAEAPAIATTKTKPKAAVAKPKKEASVIVDVTETIPVAPITVETTKTTPKKTSPKSKPTKIAPVEPIAVSPEITMHERIGLTAGSIWHYLAENGATSVAKLVEILPEAEEIIQRSIGWLAQEDKITLVVLDQVETIALK